jgi:hypothetical protein
MAVPMKRAPATLVVARQQIRLPALESVSQGKPKQQRQQHPHRGHSAGQRNAALKQPGVELQPHQKHEQHQAQLPEQVELGAHRRAEQPGRKLGLQRPQQAGPEQDAAQHAGLAEAIGQLPQQLGHRDHHGHGQQGGDQGGKLHGRGRQGLAILMPVGRGHSQGQDSRQAPGSSAAP